MRSTAEKSTDPRTSKTKQQHTGCGSRGKTGHPQVLRLNPGRDLWEWTPEVEEAGVKTRGVTNVEAGASTEIKDVVRTRYLKQLG